MKSANPPSKIDKETEEQIHRLQILEQNLQAVLMQKQAFQLELSEIENALKELKTADSDEIYKISGQIMLKAKKTDVEGELKEKQALVSARIKAFDTKESTISKHAEELREKVLEKIQKH